LDEQTKVGENEKGIIRQVPALAFSEMNSTRFLLALSNPNPVMMISRLSDR
jgi:hypothetical protein